MGFDIFNINFTGNLTADATQKDFSNLEEGKKNRVINFTLAVNINEKTTLFLRCNYWTNSKNVDTEKPKQELVSLLTKGKKIAVESGYAKVNSSSTTNEGIITKYENLEFTVEKLVLL